MERKSFERPAEEVETRFVGVSIQIALHEEFREAAAKENISAPRLLRKLIVKHLDGNGAKRWAEEEGYLTKDGELTSLGNRFYGQVKVDFGRV